MEEHRDEMREKQQNFKVARQKASVDNEIYYYAVTSHGICATRFLSCDYTLQVLLLHVTLTVV